MLLRTNIYLQKQVVDYFKERARQQGETMAEIIRRVLERQMKKEGESNWAESLLALSKGAGKSRLGDLSKNHDDYLYGKRRIK